ncbi:hypothetical protein NP493_30g02020 [Ridgeia piscesae]|uniref:Uncharacterized protein n=1 Tax=Ridgeia piscesae TaxID=27915 RepID=A0AAD9UK13_RIDPI|nr:hypothetical protein NP493_30g02020 [Ridgeia piscesae]
MSLVYFENQSKRYDYPNVWGICCTMSQTIQQFNVTRSTCYVSVVCLCLTGVKDQLFTNTADSWRASIATHCSHDPKICKSEKLDHSQTLWRRATHTRWHHLTWQATRLLHFCPSLKSLAFLSRQPITETRLQYSSTS